MTGTETRRHTVFLLQGKDLQQNTVNKMTQWSQAGLLHPVSFLNLGDLVDGARPQDVEHFMLIAGELQQPTRLLDWLSDNYCDVIRIVTLHTSTPEGDETDGVHSAEQLREELVRYIGPEQHLVTLACFLIDPDTALASPQSVLPTWSANLVISPTDQSLPGGAAAPVPAYTASGETNQAFADLASQNLCTLGAAWAFVGEGPMDSWSADSGPQGVQLVRSFVRSLDLADPTVQVTENALKPGSGTGAPGWPVPTSTPQIISAIPPEPFSREAADQLCDRHSEFIDLVTIPPAAYRPMQKIKLLAALKMFFSYMVKGVKEAPRVMLDAAVAAASTAASNMATGVLFGSSSAFEVSIGKPHQRPTSDTEALQKALESAIQLANPTTRYMPANTKVLWEEYLRVGIALVDASTMPPEQSRPQIGDAHAVLQDPSDVVIRPDYPKLRVSKESLDDRVGVELTAFDPMLVNLTVGRLRDRLTVLIGQSPEAEAAEPAAEGEGEADSPASEPSILPPAYQPAAGTPPPPPPPPPSAVSGGDGAPSDNPEEAAVDPAEAARLEAVELTQTQLHTVEEWVRNTREPYAWRVGSRIGDGLGKAQMELLIAIATLQQPRPTMPTDHDTSRKAIYRLLGFGIGTLAATLIYSLVVWKFGWIYRISSAQLVAAGVLTLIVCVLWAFRKFWKDLAERFRRMHQYESGIDQRNEATKAFAHYAREALRLNSAYWQYLRWTPILSSLLHDPFAGRTAPTLGSTPMLLADAPRATRSATAKPDTSKLDVLTHEARRTIFTMGWAQRSWEAAKVQLSEDFHTQRALNEVSDPFEENPRRPNGLLDYLSTTFMVGGHGQACRLGPETTTRELISSSSIGAITTEVLVDGTTAYPDPAAPQSADPAEGLFREIIPLDVPTHFVGSLWTREGLGAKIETDKSIIAMAPSWREVISDSATFMETLPLHHEGQLLFAGMRIDLSETCSTDELTMFDSQILPKPATTYTAVADDEGD